MAPWSLRRMLDGLTSRCIKFICSFIKFKPSTTWNIRKMSEKKDQKDLLLYGISKEQKKYVVYTYVHIFYKVIAKNNILVVSKPIFDWAQTCYNYTTEKSCHALRLYYQKVRGKMVVKLSREKKSVLLYQCGNASRIIRNSRVIIDVLIDNI